MEFGTSPKRLQPITKIYFNTDHQFQNNHFPYSLGLFANNTVSDPLSFLPLRHLMVGWNHINSINYFVYIFRALLCLFVVCYVSGFSTPLRLVSLEVDGHQEFSGTHKRIFQCEWIITERQWQIYNITPRGIHNITTSKQSTTIPRVDCMGHINTPPCSLLPSWSNHMLSKVRDEITYPFPNFKSCTIEVWEWISSFTPHLVITYLCWDLSLIVLLAYLKPFKNLIWN